MTLVTSSQVFLVGLTGGVLIELVHWYALRREEQFPEYARSWLYWVMSAMMALAGGGLAVLYFGGRAEGVVALHVGLSAPLILQKLTTTIVQTPGAKGTGPTIYSFLRW